MDVKRKLTNIGRHLKKILNYKNGLPDHVNSKIVKDRLTNYLSEYGLKVIIKLHDKNLPFSSFKEMEALMTKILKDTENGR